MARSRPESLWHVLASAVVLGLAWGVHQAAGAPGVYLAAFAIGLLTASVEVARVAGGDARPERVGVLESALLRGAGGGLAVLACATVVWCRYGAVGGLAIPSLEILQNVLAAGLGAGLLMRLPLLVALGNEPLMAAGQQGD